MDKKPALKFSYRNHHGEIENCVVDPYPNPVQYLPPAHLKFDSDGGMKVEMCRRQIWILAGVCRSRRARRIFALKRIVGPIEEVV